MEYETNKENGIKISQFNAEIRECTIDEVDKIYELQNTVIDNLDNKDYFLPFDKDDYKNIIESPIVYGNIYGCFDGGKLIAWIFLATKESIAGRITSHVNIEKNKKYADLDGVIVHPKYRGNRLQLALMKYTEERAKEKGIDYLLGEITEGNTHSVNNFLKLEYKKIGELIKNDSFKREIYIKKI